MKGKRIVFRHFHRRLIALLCLSVGYAVWYWQTPNESVSTRFLVKLQTEPKTVIENRNLSEYAYGGKLHPCFAAVKQCGALDNQARHFVLRHWQDKKRAYIIVEYQGADVWGEQYIFIEPDNKGQWEIVFRENVGAANISMRGFGTNIKVETASFIKTKRATKDDYPYKLGTTYLSFLDKDGKEIAWL